MLRHLPNQHDETVDNFAAMAAELPLANTANATKSMWADKYRGVSSIFFSLLGLEN
jgi:hypothetical protein